MRWACTFSIRTFTTSLKSPRKCAGRKSHGLPALRSCSPSLRRFIRRVGVQRPNRRRRCVMSERFELLIGWRHLRANRGRGFVSFIATISMGGVALGVAVLIAVLSVMNGFEHELRSRILSLMPHATISGFGAGIADWQAMAERGRTNAEIVASAPYIEEQALLISGGESAGVAVTGIVPELERGVSELPAKMKDGAFESLQAGTFGIVLGSELAKQLEVGIGDRVVMATSQPVVTPIGVVPRMRGFKVVGTFA